jgi:RNA polymerase sigma factor (sigma-70 family)
MRNHYVENLALLRRILAGDQTARAKLVLDNMGLVHFWAGKLMRKWVGPTVTIRGKGECARKWRREELIERGIAGLVEGAAHVENCKHENIGSFLAAWIRGAMFRPDPSLIRDLPRPKPGEPGIKVFQQLDGELDRLQMRLLCPEYKRNRYIDDDPAKLFWQRRDFHDLWLLILWLCGDDADRDIVRLRRSRLSTGEEDGYSVPVSEVAERLGLSDRTIQRRIAKIWEKLCRVRQRRGPITGSPPRNGHAGNGKHQRGKRSTDPP